MRANLSASALWVILAATVASAQDASVDYGRDIKPILRERCYACHGALKQESGLRLDTAASLLKGGESGPAVVAGAASRSRIVERIESQDAASRMPPEGLPLTAEQVGKIRSWIGQGAPGSSNESPEQDPREHWAFRTPVRPPLPRLKSPAESRNAIDAFILAKLEASDLSPRPLADKPALLRRVSLDLVGLPPTRDELRDFLADDSPAAYESVVDRLLEDPRYGERWGRHWMDVWRYADWYGRRYVPDVWNSAPQIWRWRDWIVHSLNEDRGYDRMVREMLAADEISPVDDSAAVATGYLIRNWYALNPNDWMRANVEHTSKAFLGLTIHCAHCHDHKYDPITQDDYFRLRAFFEPIGIRQDRVAGEADPGPFQEYSYSVLRKVQRLGAVRIFDRTPDAPTWFYTGGDERNRVASRGSMPPAVPAFLTNSSVRVEPVALPARAWYPGLRPENQEALRSDQRATIAAVEKSLAAADAEANAALPLLREKVAAAEAELAEEQRNADQKVGAGALVGKQSLLLNAATGRRTLQNGLRPLKALEDGTTISFQLRILNDAHVNFQLAKDVVQGLTAGYVAFDKGRILSYQPGSFTEFQAGLYDFAAGQSRFEVSLVLETKADRCLLTVRSLGDERTLVDHAPVALNGWNPVGDPKKAVSFDARTGSVAAVDELTVTGPAVSAIPPVRLVQIGFEPPAYGENRDVGGVEDWQISQFSQAPATSMVTASIGNDSLRAAMEKVHSARRAVAVHELKTLSLEAKRLAGVAQLAGLEARIAAERARYGEMPGEDAEALARIASERHREAALRATEADVLTFDQALAVAEAKPASDANRVKELEAAARQLAAARGATDKARAALADPAQASQYPTLGPTYPPQSTGRRRTLAQWITSRDNPLAARVAVNHLWLRHFHAPLVSSVFDFGRNGARPTHPELLDWLAVELMDSGWSMKRLHRLMVTSAAYRRVSSAGDPTLRATDPENRLLWRMNTGRMEAEVVRDSLLYAAGRLDLTMGGQELENSLALTTFRRTLYYSCQPELDGKSSFGALFDAPEPADCYRRTRSVIPQQALALTNSELVHELSGQLAATLWRNLAPEQQSQPQAFVTCAYEQILGRPPTAAETQACVEFLQPQVAAHEPAGATVDATRLREGLLRALLSHNDFISIR